MHWLGGAVQDIRFTFRRFRKNLGFIAIALGTIALGIGSSTAVFSVVHAVLLKPLPYRDPGRLVSLSEKRLSMPGLDRLSFATGHDLMERSGVIEDLLYYRDGGGGRLIEDGDAEVLRGQRVSANFFDMLGIRAALGRTFVASDSLLGSNDVIILSHALWHSRFGSDPAIIGRILHLGGRLIRVIGVLPEDFQPMHMSNPGEIPQVFQAYEIAELDPHNRQAAGTAIARLKPGITAGQAQVALDAIMRDLVRERPADYPRDAELTVQPLQEKLIGQVCSILWALLGAAGFVLLITAANVANLLLTRASARETEMAVRAALGGGRGRLIRQMLTESSLLGVLGGLGGLLLAWAATIALAAVAPTEVPRLAEVRVDRTVLGFATAISLLAGVLSGCAPALKAARLQLNGMLQGSRDLSGGRAAHSVRRLLVIAEIASAFVLASGAGLVGRSLDQLLHVNGGYDPNHLLTMTTLIYDDTLEKRLQHFRRVVERVRALPGVEGAAMVSTLPLSSPQQSNLFVEGRPLANRAEAPVVDSDFVSPSYFRVMRIPLRRGRFFTDQDGPTSTPVAIISESCARWQFPHEDPVGRRISIDGGQHWMIVVGVVGDVLQYGMDEGPSAGVYCPQAQWPDYYYRMVVRTPGDPWRIYPAVRAVMLEIDPNQPMFHVQPMNDYVTKSLANRIFALWLIGLLGALALVLAAIGVYGVVSYSVSLRMREFGVRIAMGAVRHDLLWLVFGDLLRAIGFGLGAGLLLAMALGRFVARLLYGVPARDPVTLLTAGLILTGVALLAALVPCRRAFGADPSAALRQV